MVVLVVHNVHVSHIYLGEKIKANCKIITQPVHCKYPLQFTVLVILFAVVVHTRCFPEDLGIFSSITDVLTFLSLQFYLQIKWSQMWPNL